MKKIKEFFVSPFAPKDPQAVSLPAGFPGAATELTLCGRGYVEIDGCLGLEVYERERISVRVKEGLLEISGRRLALRIYRGARAAVCGEIDALSFKEGDLP